MAMRIRGAAMRPRSAASLNPAGVPPASRTVVKPASSVSRACCAASNAASVGGVSARCCIVLREPKKWTWESIMPGMTVAPPTSMTRAPSGSASIRPTAAMRPPSMTTLASATGSAPVPSMSVAPVTTVVMCGLLARCA